MPDLDSDSVVSVENDALDLIDRQIIHALAVEPRASFRTIGEVVGVSDQTAARRYRKLRESVGLGIYGLVRGPLAGWVDWLVRLQTTPGSATRSSCAGCPAAAGLSRSPLTPPCTSSAR